MLRAIDWASRFNVDRGRVPHVLSDADRKGIPPELHVDMAGHAMRTHTLIGHMRRLLDLALVRLSHRMPEFDEPASAEEPEELERSVENAVEDDSILGNHSHPPSNQEASGGVRPKSLRGSEHLAGPVRP